MAVLKDSKGNLYELYMDKPEGAHCLKIETGGGGVTLYAAIADEVTSLKTNFGYVQYSASTFFNFDNNFNNDKLLFFSSSLEGNRVKFEGSFYSYLLYNKAIDLKNFKCLFEYEAELNGRRRFLLGFAGQNDETLRRTDSGFSGLPRSGYFLNWANYENYLAGRVYYDGDYRHSVLNTTGLFSGKGKISLEMEFTTNKVNYKYFINGILKASNSMPLVYDKLPKGYPAVSFGVEYPYSGVNYLTYWKMSKI